MLYSYKQQFPTELPDRIRLSSGRTRTDKTTFTPEELLDAGYVAVADIPHVDIDCQYVTWSGVEWSVSDYTEQETLEKQWERIRTIRNGTIITNEWRVNRHLSELRLGLPPTEDLQDIDQYMQGLRDITKQSDPTNLVWPKLASHAPTTPGLV